MSDDEPEIMLLHNLQYDPAEFSDEDPTDDYDRRSDPGAPSQNKSSPRRSSKPEGSRAVFGSRTFVSGATRVNPPMRYDATDDYGPPFHPDRHATARTSSYGNTGSREGRSVTLLRLICHNVLPIVTFA